MALFGCAGGGIASDPVLTVELAKASVLAEEERIASFVPARYLERLDQLEAAHLISCSRDGYTWPGQGSIVLKGDPDISSLLADIAEAYEGKEGFTVELGTTRDGAERVIISNGQGANYFISPSVNGIDIDVSSFSACFELGPDEWAGDAY